MQSVEELPPLVVGQGGGAGPAEREQDEDDEQDGYGGEQGVGGMPYVHALLQHAEVRLPPVAERHHRAVEHRAGWRSGGEGLQLRVAPGDLVAPAAADPHALGPGTEHRPHAVSLELQHPPPVVRRQWRRGRQHRRGQLGHGPQVPLPAPVQRRRDRPPSERSDGGAESVLRGINVLDPSLRAALLLLDVVATSYGIRPRSAGKQQP